MKLYIKNISGTSSQKNIDGILNELDINFHGNLVEGELVLDKILPPERLNALEKKLIEKGFKIIYDRRQILCEKIKITIHELVNNTEERSVNYSVFISKALHLSYTYLANTFSETEGITIEHYIIDQKIFKAQSMLLHNYSVSEIADLLNYSNIAHFSNQFKKVTGLTPSEFKKKQSGQ